MQLQPPSWIDNAADNLTIIRATRLWVQYGIVGFAVFCIVIGAVESLFGR
jgi:hypothetical protein